MAMPSCNCQPQYLAARLSGAAEPSAEVQCEEAQDEEGMFNGTSHREVGGMLEVGGPEPWVQEDSEPRRPPPPDMPPPPCPAGARISFRGAFRRFRHTHALVFILAYDQNWTHAIVEGEVFS